MEFTGERLIPQEGLKYLYYEHVTRYLYAAHWARGLRVLDAGCGVGYGSAILRRHGAEVLGIDVSEEAIEYAKTNYRVQGLQFDVMDCLNLGVADGSFDMAVSFEVIEHLQDPDRFLCEIRRILRPQGIFICSTPNKHLTPSDHCNPYHVQEFHREAFVSLLSKHFPATEILGQTYAEGMAIGHLQGPQEAWDTVLDAGISSGSNVTSVNEVEPPYFVAICWMSAHLRSPLHNRYYAIPRMSLLQEGTKERDAWIEILQEERRARDLRIQDLESTVRERDAWVSLLQREKMERDLHIADLTGVKKERESWIAILRQEKAARDQRIADLENTVRERESWIAVLREVTDGRDRRISDLEKTVQERESWIAILQEEKAVRDQRIADLEQTVRDRESWITILREEKTVRDRRIADLESAQGGGSKPPAPST